MSEPMTPFIRELRQAVDTARAQGSSDTEIRAAVELALAPVEPLARYTVVSAGGRLFIRAHADNDHPRPWLCGAGFHPWSVVCEHGTPEVVAVPAAAISVAERTAERELLAARTTARELLALGEQCPTMHGMRWAQLASLVHGWAGQ